MAAAHAWRHGWKAAAGRHRRRENAAGRRTDAISRLQHHRRHALLLQRACAGEARQAGSHDDHLGIARLGGGGGDAPPLAPRRGGGGERARARRRLPQRAGLRPCAKSVHTLPQSIGDARASGGPANCAGGAEIRRQVAELLPSAAPRRRAAATIAA
jgi:hypothetical protein